MGGKITKKWPSSHDSHRGQTRHATNSHNRVHATSPLRALARLTKAAPSVPHRVRGPPTNRLTHASPRYLRPRRQVLYRESSGCRLARPQLWGDLLRRIFYTDTCGRQNVCDTRRANHPFRWPGTDPPFRSPASISARALPSARAREVYKGNSLPRRELPPEHGANAQHLALLKSSATHGSPCQGKNPATHYPP